MVWGLVFAAISILAGVGFAGLAIYVRRKHEGPGSKAFVTWMVGTALYVGSYGVNLLTFDTATSVLLEIPYWVAGELVTIGFFFFALAFTGRARYLTARNAALASLVPAATVLVVVTNSVGLHEVFWSNYTIIDTFGAGVRDFDRGPWLFVKSTYAFILFSAGLLMIGEEIYIERSLYRNQSVALLVALLIGILGYNAWLLELGPYPHVEFAPVLAPVSLLLYGYAVIGADLFEASPAVRRIGRHHTVDNFADAVVIIDSDGVVTDLNDSAEVVLGCQRTEALGANINALLTDASIDFTESTQSVSVQTGAGWREFEVTVGAMTSAGEDIGYTVVFHDITDQQRRKQRLEVLNRVLRHNLRNNANAIVGFAEIIQDQSKEPQIKQWATKITESSRELVAFGEKARDVETAIETEHSREQIDLQDLLTEIISDYRERYPEARIELEVDDREVYADATLLRLVFSNLIENGIEHNDTADPWVAVRAETGPDGFLAVAVEDNGPGIPEQDLASLRAGNETDLQHGHGLGLWLVEWCVTVLGGRTAFEATEDGTTVTTWLPATARASN